jgi:hypothetical protein
MLAIGTVMAGLALLGGWLGWRRGTRALYRRRSDEVLGHRGIEQGTLRRRRIERLALSLASAVAAVVIGLGILTLLAR